MKYLSCFLLESGISLRKNDICPCMPGKEITYIPNYKGQPFDIDEYIRVRNKYVNMLRNGEIPHQCIGCSNLEEKDWSDEPGIEYISISNETKCSCNCYYCVFAKDKENNNAYKGYNFMPVIKGLEENSFLRQPTFDIAGGECTEYPPEQLEDLVNFTIEHKYYLHFFSSGIIYSDIIAKAMHHSVANIIVSIDSGTKKLYEKIKRVKAYERVWENVAKYSREGIQNWHLSKGFTILKYIIIPGVNDNFEELEEFVLKAKISGCKWIRFSVEYNWWNEHYDKKIPENLWEILDYAETLNDSFRVEYIENAIYLWRRRMQDDKNYKGKNPCENSSSC